MRNKIIKNILFLVLFSICTFLQSYAQHKNILIGRTNDPEEITICASAQKPNVLIAAANTDSYYFSSDTGKTWRTGTLRSSFGVWGDPCLLSDSQGNFYFFHLSKMKSGNAYDRIVCQKSFNNGIDWTNGNFLGLNGNNSQDKEWAAIDPKTNYIYVLWTEQRKNQTRSASKITTDINFSISSDLGKNWSKAKNINEKPGADFDNWKTVIGAIPATGPERQVYAAWVNYDAIYFDKSLDSGKTWMERDVKVFSLNDKWNLNVPGLYRCYVFPVLACDNSSGEYRGTVYITWADKNKINNDTDVLLSKTTDEGKTWSKPVKVNNDSSSRHQYMPWITVDQTNGYIYLVFYDRRNHNGNKTDVYMARSTDGGMTFSNFKMNEKPFTPKSNVFMGDYIGLTAHNNIVRPVWTAIDDHENLSVWTAIINVDSIK